MLVVMTQHSYNITWMMTNRKTLFCSAEHTVQRFELNKQMWTTVYVVNKYLEIVSILQQEALGFQPDSFALFGSDAIDALMVVIVVRRKVWRKEDAFWSQ